MNDIPRAQGLHEGGGGVGVPQPAPDIPPLTPQPATEPSPQIPPEVIEPPLPGGLPPIREPELPNEAARF
jgi:hypothetical protein